MASTLVAAVGRGGVVAGGSSAVMLPSAFSVEKQFSQHRRIGQYVGWNIDVDKIYLLLCRMDNM